MKTGKIVLSIVVLLVFLGFSDALAQWAPNGTHIYNTNSGNVGIGISAPTTQLHVANFFTGEPIIKIHNPGLGGGATFEMVDNLSGADWKFKSTTTGAFKIRDQASALDVIYIEKNSLANVMYVNAAGQIAMRHSVPDGHGLNVINYVSGKAGVQGMNNSGTTLYSAGLLGVLEGPALGLPVYTWNVGVVGIRTNAPGGNGAGVFGWNADANNAANYGGVFVADGAATTAGYANYGVYGLAKSANLNYAGKFLGRVEVDGHANSTDAPDYLANVLVARVNHSTTSDTRAVQGISQPAENWGIGVEGLGNYMGVRGEGTSDITSCYGVYASSSGSAGSKYGVYGTASGTGTGSRIAVYGSASGGDNAWAGYFNGDAYISSDLRIATTTQAAGYSLSVNGKIACTEVLVEAFASWPDYVFADEYDLMSLEELERSIQKNNHLPGLPSAAEIEENGIHLGEMQTMLVEKVEELTLYTIEQGKMIKELQQKMDKLEKENAKLRKHSK